VRLGVGLTTLSLRLRASGIDENALRKRLERLGGQGAGEDTQSETMGLCSVCEDR